jgi:SAM-dependent methyltransferase
MTPGDLFYLRTVLSLGLLTGPVLEIGGRSWQANGNASRVCDDAGLAWEAADLEPGEGVSYVLDILDENAVATIEKRWPSVLAFNLLEHVYDPITALRHTMSLVAPGGICLVLTPAVWQLHDFPADYWRPMPDFYLEFARREGLGVLPGTFSWVVGDELIIPVEDLTYEDQKLLPSKHSQPWRSRYSDAVHRIANTAGRSMFFPYSALGCGFANPW